MSRILVISPTPTHPATAGNRVRVAALAAALRGLDHEVHLLFAPREDGDLPAMRADWGDRLHLAAYRAPPEPTWQRRLRRLGRRLGIEAAYRFGIDAWYDEALDEVLGSLLGQVRFDAVIVEYAYLSRAFAKVPKGTLKILDTHDVFSNRHRIYRQRGAAAAWFSCSPRQEARALDRADVIIAIKEAEARHFRALTRRRVITVGHIFALRAAPVAAGEWPSDEVEPGTIAVLGSANPINAEAVRWFADDVLPRVRVAVPGARLRVAGNVCQGLDERAGVDKLGLVDDVGAVYRSAAVVINPMRFGTGLKIKTVEALGYGKALVTTSVGAEGVEDGAGAGFRVADDAESFARALIDLLTREQARRDLEAGARRFLASYNDAALRQLDALFGDAAAAGS